MAGYFTNGVCFPTAQEAIDTHFSSLNIVVSNPPSSPAFIFKYVRQADGVWVISKTDLNGNLIPPLQTQTMNFASCDSPTDKATSFLNGVELGWAVSTVVVVAFVLRRLRRGT